MPTNNRMVPSRHREAWEHRKKQVRAHADQFAGLRAGWKKRTAYFHDTDLTYLRFLVPEGARVLDLGCGNGDTLAALKPSVGVGVDLSEKVIEVARTKYPSFQFYVGDIDISSDIEGVKEKPFDFIVLSDILGVLEDCQSVLESLHNLCGPDTRLIIGYYSHVWEPILKLAEMFKLKMPQVKQNYLPVKSICHLLALSDFDVVKQERRMLLPVRLGGIGSFINRYLSFLPLIRNLTVRNYTVARSLKSAPMEDMSVTIIVPCRNEKGKGLS